VQLLKRSEMFAHQSEAAALIKKIRQLLLILRPGGGKTAATLTAMADLQPWPALIVAPIRVCENVWEQEAATWTHLKGLKFELLRGTPDQRLAALDRPAHIYLINYEMLAWLVRDAGVDLGGFGAIVWDEVSMLKSPGSVRFKAVRKALEKTPADQIRVGLTGTPTGNSLLNLWGEAFVCDTGRSLGKSYVSWRARHFHTVDRDGFVWRPNHGADREIRGALKRSAAFIEPVKILLKGYRALKGYREVSIRFDLPRPARKAYEELRVQLVTQLESGKDILSLGKLPLSGKLRQILSGAIYVDAAGLVWEEIHTARLDALRDLVEELEGAPLLVAYGFRHEQERIARAFPGMVRDLSEKGAIDAWNRGDVPLLTLHPLSGGHGLNLQHGGADLCCFSLPWSSEQYQQTIGRLDRPGQRREVMVHRLEAKGSLDREIANALAARATVERKLSHGLSPHPATAERRPSAGSAAQPRD